MSAKCSSDKFFKTAQIHIRVLITIPLGWKEQSLRSLQHHPQYIFILHHADPPFPLRTGLALGQDVSQNVNAPSRDILTWNNSYLAGELASVRGHFPADRAFTPSCLPIAARRPPFSISSPNTDNDKSFLHLLSCTGGAPIAVIQGGIGGKRDLYEIEAVMTAASTDLRMHIKVLTRHDPIRHWMENTKWHIEWLQHLNMTAYHEAFQEASFLIAGMNPSAHPDYFHGHPSSNIAYAIHYGLSIIGHQAIEAEYLALSAESSTLIYNSRPVPGGGRGVCGGRVTLQKKGFWHDGSVDSITAATRQAIAAWQKSCRSISLNEPAKALAPLLVQ